jgi:putative PIN family toxin of toxin-antitoxin system
MTRSERWVIDANVLVSAMLFDESVPGRAAFDVLNQRRLLVSPASLREIIEVVNRRRFDKYVDSDDREEFLKTVLEAALVIEPGERIEECRDPKDNRYLELAVAGQAAGIITGDEDLLVLHPFRGIPILTPAQYLAEHVT